MKSFIIDCLQYANWNRKIFEEMNKGKVNAIHVTISYHESFEETVKNLVSWNKLLEENNDIIFQGFSTEDISFAKETGKTAIFFGFQNPSSIQQNIGYLEVWHRLGIRFMQLTYNNQSLLASGCYEKNDNGLSRMGLEVINEMNRLGIVIDMSHAGKKSTIDAIESSKKPIAITHANPSFWHNVERNVSSEVLKKLSKNKGMIGFSLYPNHLLGGSDCTLNSFCKMIVDTVDLIGINSVGIGSDLVQGQPDEVVAWMRNGKWRKTNYKNEEKIKFPKATSFFKNNCDLKNIGNGLRSYGMNKEEIEKIMGNNWFNFFNRVFK